MPITHCQSVRRVEHAIRFKIDGRVILCVCINIHSLRTTECHVWLSVQQFVFDFFGFRLKMNSIASCYSPHWDVEPLGHTHDLRIYSFYWCFRWDYACVHPRDPLMSHDFEKGYNFRTERERAIVSDDQGQSESDERLVKEKNGKRGKQV